MRLHLAKVDELQFLKCLSEGLWGSRKLTFRTWRIGDHLGLIVSKAVAALARVEGEPFVSNEKIWEDDIYPNRIPIRFIRAMNPENRPQMDPDIRTVLIREWGPKYGWGIRAQFAIEGKAADRIISAINSKPDDTIVIRREFEGRIAKAREVRRINQILRARRRGKPGRPPKSEALDEELDVKVA